MREYLSAREELIGAAAPGLTPARRLARLTDDNLLDLAQRAAGTIGRPTRWALIALGGYGAGALLPGSDLDLLIVSGASPQTLKPFVEALLYPLWDAGLKVGHQVRSRKEQVRAVRADLATLTATLTGRVIAGDNALGTEVLHACAADAHKRRADVLRVLAERDRPGTPYLLEPDLKDGAGGRRDFDELTWTAAVLTGAPQSDPSALVSLGMITAEERTRLASAADIVAAARWELQLAGGSQRMSLDAADEMQTDSGLVQQALADTHHLLVRTRRRVAGTDARIDTGAMSALDILELVGRGESALPELEEAAWAGRFEPTIPGMASLMTLRRPGLGHTLTVGAHCLLAATLVGHLGDRSDVGEVAARSAGAVTDPRAVSVAALIHDIGKETPGAGHAERGASTARGVARRFDLDEEADTVSELVRLHLVLAETASRQDLDDEDAILRVAADIGDRALIAPLHLLTIADSIATGPTAWNDWHAALLGKLVTRLDAALSPDVDGAGMAASAEEVRAQALRLTQGQARQFVERAPLRYLAGRSPEQVADHASLVTRLASDRSPVAHELEISSGPLPGSFLVTVAAPDRHGLLATLAGVFALAGLDILAVEAVSDPSGVALDTFTLRSATLADIGPDIWARVERSLDAALRDRFALSVRLAERRRHYRDTETGVRRVTVDTEDPYATVVRVRAVDRVGLLHDVARAIAESGLEIASMTATTRQGVADDTFRLAAPDGEVPREAGLLGQLKMRLRELG